MAARICEDVVVLPPLLSSEASDQQLLLQLCGNHLSEAAYNGELMMMNINNGGSCDHYRYQPSSGHHNDNDYYTPPTITSNSLLMDLLQAISGGEDSISNNNDDQNHDLELAHPTIAHSSGSLMDESDANYKLGAPYPTSFLAMEELVLDNYSVQALPVLSSCHGDFCDCSELELAGSGIDYRPATPTITPLTPANHHPVELSRLNSECSSRSGGAGSADYHTSSNNNHSHGVITPSCTPPSPSLLEYANNYHNCSLPVAEVTEMADLHSAPALNLAIHGELELGQAMSNPRMSQFRVPNSPATPCYNKRSSIRDRRSQYSTISAHEAVSSSSSSCGHVSPAPATNRSHVYSSSHHNSTSSYHYHVMASSADRDASLLAAAAESVGAAGILHDMDMANHHHQKKKEVINSNLQLYNEPMLLAAAAAAAASSSSSSKAELYRRAAMAPVEDDDDEPLAMAVDGINHHNHNHQRSRDFSCSKMLKINDGNLKPMGQVKRRNVKISKDPQSVAARQRRERISERILTLQRYVPWARKLDTASMLEEAVQYLKFLKAEVQSYAEIMMLTCSPNPNPNPNSNHAGSAMSARPGSSFTARDSVANSGEGNLHHRHRHLYLPRV